MWMLDMAQRICFREEYNAGMKGYYSGKEDSRPKPKKTIYENVTVSHQYLWIDQFVWALALCEIRISCPAVVDCNGTIRKIHMKD